MSHPLFTDTQIANFLKKIAIDENGCWIWTASKHKRGYGQLTINDELRKAHRVSWEMNRGHALCSRRAWSHVN